MTGINVLMKKMMMMKFLSAMRLLISRFLVVLVLVSSVNLSACSPDDGGGGSGEPVVNLLGVTISTDKAMYHPAELVTFTLNMAVPSTSKVRYRYLNETLLESPIIGKTWTWQLPSEDFRGYMVEVISEKDGKQDIITTIAVDASSDWTRFPRYGFLSKFDQMSDSEVDEVMFFLNRCHINGLQFYDWLNKHHKPLAGTVSNPAAQWKDIFNRDIYKNTVQQYIAAAHERNMKAMFYNLLFGAWSGAGTDGVQEQWYLFKDSQHNQKDKHPLPQPPFLSDIFLVNPGNTNWMNYLGSEHSKVYQVYDFDGFHIDQLGDRGPLYDYNGASVDLDATFGTFIQAMKDAHPEKFHVMNAVAQFGQDGIGTSPVDFMYTETWEYGNFGQNANIIKANDALSSNTKKTVLAAYMNYDRANSPGEFNTHSILLADAEIFAFGGAHLELGEHMLGKEYFPNENLKMPDVLRRSIISYYDFSVAYQNLLRDGGSFNNVNLTSINSKISTVAWPGQSGKVAVIGKEFENRQVIHFINFSNVSTMQWRDTHGTQSEPKQIDNIQLGFVPTKPVKKIWFASPDVAKGSPQELVTTVVGNMVTFTMPSLKYWDMIVVEY